MIELEITHSTDTDAIGVYQFELNQVFIGRSKYNDVVLFDSSLEKKALALKIENQQLLAIGDEYLVNGKKFKGLRKLKSDDLIQLGQHQIKIRNFRHETYVQIDTGKLYDMIAKENPELLDLLTKIENRMIELEEGK